MKRLDKKKLNIHLGPYSRQAMILNDRVEKLKESLERRFQDDDKLNLMQHFEAILGDKQSLVSTDEV